MGLNIKNERVHRLAREAARVTGRTQTGAIEEALVKLLREYDVDPDRPHRAGGRPRPGHRGQWQADPGRVVFAPRTCTTRRPGCPDDRRHVRVDLDPRG
jgi:antitoxin VapB